MSTITMIQRRFLLIVRHFPRFPPCLISVVYDYLNTAGDDFGWSGRAITTGFSNGNQYSILSFIDVEVKEANSEFKSVDEYNIDGYLERVINDVQNSIVSSTEVCFYQVLISNLSDGRLTFELYLWFKIWLDCLRVLPVKFHSHEYLSID